jgi:hypothetical protein
MDVSPERDTTALERIKNLKLKRDKTSSWRSVSRRLFLPYGWPEIFQLLFYSHVVPGRFGPRRALPYAVSRTDRDYLTWNLFFYTTREKLVPDAVCTHALGPHNLVLLIRRAMIGGEYRNLTLGCYSSDDVQRMNNIVLLLWFKMLYSL